VTAQGRDAAEYYMAGIDQALAMQMGAQASFEAALAVDETCAMAHIALSREFQYRGKTAEAQASKDKAVQCMQGVTRREQQHIIALARAVEGDGPTALALIREHVQEFPRDAFLLKQADGPFGLIGFGGSQDRLEANFALLDSVADAYGEDWWFLSAYAFAHNELGRHETARRLVQRALALHPQSGHSAHTMAHVFFETGDHISGAAFLQEWMPEFPRQAQIYSHLTWHWALFALANGEPEQAHALYTQTLDPAVCPGAPLIALCDAAALLWRCDLYGLSRPAGSREAVAAFAAQTFPRAGIAFGDVHCALAYAAAGDTAALTRLATQLQERLVQEKLASGVVVPALVEALLAFASGDYEGAVQHLEPVADQVVRVGGSNAQREVFEDTLLQAYLRAGRVAQATTLLQQRLTRRPSARDMQWLQQVNHC
jgi:tetratricopeptide (TPR) repeat protein